MTLSCMGHRLTDNKLVLTSLRSTNTFSTKATNKSITVNKNQLLYIKINYCT